MDKIPNFFIYPAITRLDISNIGSAIDITINATTTYYNYNQGSSIVSLGRLINIYRTNGLSSISLRCQFSPT